MTNQYALGYAQAKADAGKVCDDLYKHERKDSGYDEGWNDGLGVAENLIKEMK